LYTPATDGLSVENVVLKDGTQYIIYKNGLDSTDAGNLDIIVDLNGNKKPNIIGKDAFCMRFNRGQNKLIFIDPGDRNFLKNNSIYGCNKTASDQPGLYCGALIQYDGWKIADDYPW
jgi:hypothetical protein